jgi:hypothetical protein
VLTSNRGFGDWGQVFADQVVAGEILDEKGATTFPAGYTTSFRIGWALDWEVDYCLEGVSLLPTLTARPDVVPGTSEALIHEQVGNVA